MTHIEWIYHLVAAKQPIDREAIGQHADKAGLTSHRVTDILRILREARMLATDGRAFRLGPTPPRFNVARGHGPNAKKKAAAPVKGPIEPAPGTMAAIALDVVRRGNGEKVAYRTIAEAFRKKGKDHRSAGLTMTELLRRGLVARPERAHYVPVKQPSQ